MIIFSTQYFPKVTLSILTLNTLFNVMNLQNLCSCEWKRPLLVENNTKIREFIASV